MEDGVMIYSKFYPWPKAFRMGDPVLVREVTGMDWPEFVRALNTMDEADAPDQVVLAGLIAVAFWQKNPQMSRDKARRAIEKLPQSEVEIIEGDADPPAVTEAGERRPPISSGSDDSPEEAVTTEIEAAFI